ncbi:response regulator [Seonamhaeicola sp.]|uniref:response regulator n=1 Tax=Seonamhaeicola sp. TaxID=1912245 RepID=UPI0026304C37|nr:response regulator [Seonamhaeicola sp.]
MEQSFNVLIVDDHPLIVKAYTGAFKQVERQGKYSFSIDSAATCDEAALRIKGSLKGSRLGIVFLDIKLPESRDGKIISGEDLGVLIRRKSKKTKIIVSTTFNDNSRLNSILKSISPEGLLVKNDLTPEVLVEAIKGVITEPPFYCKTVLRLLRKLSSNDFTLDSIDRKLLYELSKGAKMSELPDILMLSIAALERRKRILKEMFDVVGKGDRELIKAAEDKGFI